MLETTKLETSFIFFVSNFNSTFSSSGYWVKKEWFYLSSGGFSVSEHVGSGGDDVDSEANKQSSNCRVYGSKEGEDYSQEPYGYHHWQPC